MAHSTCNGDSDVLETAGCQLSGTMRGEKGYIFLKIYLFFCALMLCLHVPDPLELELQTIVSCHVGAGN